MKKIILFVLLILISLCAEGIKENFYVVLTEDFEEVTIEEMAAQWDEVVNLEGMSFSSDVSSVSPGSQSLMMTSIIGSNTGGHLYKRLADYAGYDTLYARFYVKFAENCHPVHHFVHMGGYNPPTLWPQGGAGIRPDGDERFTTGIEPMGSNWRWDFYTYWMHMRGNPVPNTYWGNTFHPTPQVLVERGEWICVEIMMICNNPVDSYNGEQAFWINGEQAIHLGEGFPNGYWIWDKFYPHPDSAPFEGFQWRFVDELKINFFWLLFYMTQGSPGQVDSVWFDDVVVATEYIGPIAGISERETSLIHNLNLEIYPNPFSKSTVISYSSLVINDQLPVTNDLQCSALRIYDVSGRIIRSFDLASGVLPLTSAVSWDGTDNSGNRVPPGVYFCRLRMEDKDFTKKVIKIY